MNINSNQETVSADDRAILELRQVLAGAQAAMTDEMVSRLAETLSQGVGLLDQIERSGIDKILPLLSEMVESGDLERIIRLARVVSAAQEALTDEMVSRLIELVSNAMTLLDRVNRTGLDDLVTALPDMVSMFNHLQQQHLVDDLMDSVEAGTALAKTSKPASGGLKGLWAIAREPETQETLRFLLLASKQFRACRTERQSNGV